MFFFDITGGIRTGALYEKYGYRIIYDAASSMDARVARVLKEKEWRCKPARSEELMFIQS